MTLRNEHRLVQRGGKTQFASQPLFSPAFTSARDGQNRGTAVIKTTLAGPQSAIWRLSHGAPTAPPAWQGSEKSLENISASSRGLLNFFELALPPPALL
jgi:hypothetical protein